MRRIRTPKFGPLSTGRHQADPTQLSMSDDGDYAGAHRREGRHGISPATQPHNRPVPTGAPAGQHRKTRTPQSSSGRHRAPETSSIWYPSKADWRRLYKGETVNGHRLVTGG